MQYLFRWKAVALHNIRQSHRENGLIENQYNRTKLISARSNGKILQVQ